MEVQLINENNAMPKLAFAFMISVLENEIYSVWLRQAVFLGSYYYWWLEIGVVLQYDVHKIIGICLSFFTILEKL